jgi:Domain of unknown function (DUF1772)
LFSVSIASRVDVVTEMIEIVVLVLVGPLVGVEFGVAAFTNPRAANLLTVTTLVPINNRISRWKTDADVSRDLAGRWDRWHWLRVGLLAGARCVLADRRVARYSWQVPPKTVGHREIG